MLPLKILGVPTWASDEEGGFQAFAELDQKIE